LETGWDVFNFAETFIATKMIYVTRVPVSEDGSRLVECEEESAESCACAFCDEKAKEMVVVKKAFDDAGQCFAVPLCERCKMTYDVLTVWKSRLMIV